MELITLDSSFKGLKLIENYESLIWTERYGKAGDFELKSSDIKSTIAALPIDVPGASPTYVTLRESTVPMLIENHLIEKEGNKPPVITVTGRSFEACALERRASVNSLPQPISGTPNPRKAWMLSAAKESDAAYEAMRVVLGDVVRTQLGAEVLPAVNPAVSPNDAIPEIDLILPKDYKVVTWSSTAGYAQDDIVYYAGSIYQASPLANNLNKVPSSEPTFWTYVTAGPIPDPASNLYEIKPGDLYSTVMDLITTNHHGIKSVRPMSGGTKVGIEIYNGADLTNSLSFDARFDQFDSAKYLLSNQGSTNVGYIYGSNGSLQVLKTAAPEPSGLARKVLVLDQTSDTTTGQVEVLNARGLIELYKYNATALFNGEISQQIANGYNRDYFLGDILKLVSEYGLSQNVRVAEFIRTSDAQGTKAYPTFEAVDDA